MQSALLRVIACLYYLSASQTALAHTGHDITGFVSGLSHPFGLDHLLAVITVGIWSVEKLPDNKLWQGPTTFMAALLTGALIGTAGFSLPLLENLIACSVIFFGVILITPGTQLSNSNGLWLIAMAAALHGLAHGAEALASGFSTYAAGFLLTTACLHLSGAALGILIRNRCRKWAQMVRQLLGVSCAGAGIYLLGQVSS